MAHPLAINFMAKQKKREPFSIQTKKREWMAAGGHNSENWRIGFIKTSKCRRRKETLRWGEGGYEFDHKDNNPANSSQRNCYLVCASCHGKVTKVKKKIQRNEMGMVIGYKTYKKKVDYKKVRRKAKPKRKHTTRKQPSSPFAWNNPFS